MVSHSSTNRFNSCPFAFKLNLDGLHKLAVGPESNYLVWGKAMHKALECYYGPEHAVGADFHRAFLDAYPNDLDATNAVWTREGGVKTLEAYDHYYGEIDQQWEVMDVELADNPEKPTLVIDLVARHRQSGSIYGWDHKFKAKMPFNASRRYELDSQITRYSAFVKQRYGDCAGFVVNTVVPGYRQRAYKGEPAGWHWKFERLIVQRTPQQIEYWERSQAEWEGLIRHCQKNDLYPKHLGYGCSQCEFYELCLSADDPEVKEALYTAEPVSNVPFEVVLDDEG